jgi:4-aminobutyrate aminotransferase
MRHSYHGRSFSAVSTTGTASWSPSSLSPFNVSYVHGGYPYRSPFRHLPDEEYVNACVEDLENVLDVATAGDVACLIAEPVQGVGGFGMPPDGLYGRFNEALKKRGILFISDEVQTGWGRTGDHFWGYQAHGFKPDILTFAKGLGNGLAIGGVVARKEIMDCFTANSISTFGGNPIATAGALANLKFLEENDLQQNAATQGQRFRDKLHQLAKTSPIIGDVRGKGLMIGVELVGSDGRQPNVEAVGQVMEVTKSNGLLIGRGGFYANVLRMAPPLSVTEEEIDEGFEIFADAIKKVEAL